MTSFFLCKDDPMHILKVVTGAVFLYHHLTGQFCSMILILWKLDNLLIRSKNQALGLGLPKGSPNWENHFGKRTVWSLIYFLNYAYLDIQSSLLIFGTPSKYHFTRNNLYWTSLHSKPRLYFKWCLKKYKSIHNSKLVSYVIWKICIKVLLKVS